VRNPCATKAAVSFGRSTRISSRSPVSHAQDHTQTNVLGYFAEVTATHPKKMLVGAAERNTFIFTRKPSQSGPFHYPWRLSEMETKILNGATHALEIEKRPL